MSIQESSAEEEDLEKKLRERALNSMKKKAAKEARNETDFLLSMNFGHSITDFYITVHISTVNYLSQLTCSN